VHLFLAPLLILVGHAFGMAFETTNSSLTFDGKPEYEARADFLLLFAKYTQWPESALPGGSEEFVIGVVGEDPFGTALNLHSGSIIQGRKLVIRHFRTAARITPCQILYFPSAEEHLLPSLREKILEWNVLTVGETPHFIETGGMLWLFTEGERLRFEVNLGALNLARVRVEAKVLRFAKPVRSDHGCDH